MKGMIGIKKDAFCKKLRELGYTKSSAYELYDDFITVLTQAIASGESVKIYGFGEFYVKNTKPHKGWDFTTNTLVDVQPKKKICFKPSETLKEVLKENND